jgi:hypothetical protein
LATSRRTNGDAEDTEEDTEEDSEEDSEENSEEDSEEDSEKDAEEGDSAPPAVRRSLKTFEGITDPAVGELYLGSWHPRGSQASPTWFAVVVLPTGSFRKVGISGSISDTRLTDYIPVCYKSDIKTRTIIGWADDYKDGGPRVAFRKFPVMYFEDDQTMPSEGNLQIPSPESLEWLPASRLRAFGVYGPDGFPARGYDTALSFYNKVTAARGAVPSRRAFAGIPSGQTTGALPR